MYTCYWNGSRVMVRALNDLQVTQNENKYKKSRRKITKMKINNSSNNKVTATQPAAINDSNSNVSQQLTAPRAQRSSIALAGGSSAIKGVPGMSSWILSYTLSLLKKNPSTLDGLEQLVVRWRRCWACQPETNINKILNKESEHDSVKHADGWQPVVVSCSKSVTKLSGLPACLVHV